MVLNVHQDGHSMDDGHSSHHVSLPYYRPVPRLLRGLIKVSVMLSVLGLYIIFCQFRNILGHPPLFFFLLLFIRLQILQHWLLAKRVFPLHRL